MNSQGKNQLMKWHTDMSERVPIRMIHTSSSVYYKSHETQAFRTQHLARMNLIPFSSHAYMHASTYMSLETLKHKYTHKQKAQCMNECRSGAWWRPFLIPDSTSLHKVKSTVAGWGNILDLNLLHETANTERVGRNLALDIRGHDRDVGGRGGACTLPLPARLLPPSLARSYSHVRFYPKL
jgi:hypothetical protein